MDNLDGDATYGIVVERETHPSGNKIGKPHKNPILDTREYIVKYPNNTVRRYTANHLVQAIYSQVDQEGINFELIEEIIGHKETNEVL